VVSDVRRTALVSGVALSVLTILCVFWGKGCEDIAYSGAILD
jgi:hypothetical protein